MASSLKNALPNACSALILALVGMKGNFETVQIGQNTKYEIEAFFSF